MLEVTKTWGKEFWLVNNSQYCAKLLYLDKGATCSCHYHKIKRETFYCLSGSVALDVEDKVYNLPLHPEPITIEPGQKHRFHGLENSIILEISTHHEEEDVIRLSDSTKGGRNGV